MSGISDFMSKFRVQPQQAGHEHASAKITKKVREPLTCNQCRKSKQRCDRGQPCGSCVKRDDASCAYQRPSRPQADTGRHGLAEDRLLHLELMVKKLMQSQEAPATSDNISKSAQPATSPDILEPTDEYQLSDSTKYVGSTHWSALLDDIQELKTVLNGHTETQETEATPVADTLSSELIFGSPNKYTIEQIISKYLPPKTQTDRFLSVYFRGETFILPFIHIGLFQRQYQDFWANPTNAEPIWLSTMFSICYLGSLFSGSTIQEDDHASHGQRLKLHTAAGQCLVLGKYHRPQPYTLEALTMYAHCKNQQSLDPSRESGMIFGMVVRKAYEMGYHRDPDSFGTFSTFEGEMRRRFWAVCKQFDLMISFQLGLPSNITLETSDTKSPRNLLDSDFDVDTQVLPPARSENEATRLLWFIVKDKQMVSFSKVCKDALSFKEKSDAEILQLDEEIRQMNSTLPEVLCTRPLAESIADPPFLVMTRLYIDFIYLKSLCVLHRRYMARGSAFSTQVCVDAGKRVVTQFIDMYNEFVGGGQLYTERWMLNSFIMNDFLLGIMVLCLAVHTQWKRGAQNSVIDTASQNQVLNLLEQAHAICVEKSSTCRDARRVSYALRLTLNGAKSRSLGQSIASHSHLTPAASDVSFLAIGNGAQPDDTAAVFLPSGNGSVYGNEAAFGLLDPFNFSENSMENIDWTMFDEQALGHNALYADSFIS